MRQHCARALRENGALQQPESPTTRNIEFIIPAGTGGGADQMARAVQAIVAKHNLAKVAILPIDRSGGAGAEGFLDVKNSPGEPHKIIITLSNLFTTPLATNTPFNWRDLTPVQMLALDNFVLWVKADAPYKTPKDYIAADFVWGLIASMYLGNIAGLIVVLTCVPLFAAILRIPFSVIAPIIIVICSIGAFTVHNALFDVWMVVVFGAFGYFFRKLQYPLAPMVLAIVLGDNAEAAFRQAMLFSAGEMRIFFETPLVGSICTLALVLLFWPLIALGIRKARGR